MRILWITNGLFPEANAKLQGLTEIKGTGGWMIGLSDALVQTGDVEIIVASITVLVKELTTVQGEHIAYYAIPSIGDATYKKKYEDTFRILFKKVQPDVVHIHGTEFPHSLAVLRACGSKHTVVSLQGLASVISQYYLAGLTNRDILCNPTLHDMLRSNLYQQKREMEKRGVYEQQLIKEASFVIGRTSWDYSHTWAINPSIKYYHCNEILRSEFYVADKWCYDKCVPHSIFLSQGSYPLKGLHKVLEALPIIKKNYPDVVVRVAGPDITYIGAGLRGKLKISTYGKFIKRVIKNNNLENNVVFVGSLNAQDMVKEYLQANIFVCPSSIENSPNSLGEAQILGVPCVASYAGGIPDFMQGNEGFLYRFDDVEMLSEKISRAFEIGKAIDTSAIQQVAQKRHNTKEIVNRVLNIYNEISR